MGFLPQEVIWIHKIQFRCVLADKYKVHKTGQLFRILGIIQSWEAVIMGVFKLDCFSVEDQTWTLYMIHTVNMMQWSQQALTQINFV